MVYAMVLYLLALVLFTLYPAPDNSASFCAYHKLQPQLIPLGSISDIPTEGLRAILQVAMNMVFFVPMGGVFADYVWLALAGGCYWQARRFRY